MFDLRGYDYIVDAIDSIKSKLLLIEQAKLCHTPAVFPVWQQREN